MGSSKTIAHKLLGCQAEGRPGMWAAKIARIGSNALITCV